MSALPRGASGDVVGELIEVGRRAAARAVAAGAEAAEVLLSDGAELSVKVRLGETEMVHEAHSRALGLRVLRDRRSAVTYTSDLRPDALDRFVEDTVQLAGLAEPHLDLERGPVGDQHLGRLRPERHRPPRRAPSDRDQIARGVLCAHG
jgi:PmbA protein